MIIDEEGRKFLMNKVGNNQISGSLISLVQSNKLKAGDILTIEYDKEEPLIDGKYVIHVKLKNT